MKNIMERKNAIRRKELIKVIKKENWKSSVRSKISENRFPAEKPIEDKNHPDYIPNVIVFTRRRNTTQVYKKTKPKNLEKKVVHPEQQFDRQAAAFALMLLSSTAGDKKKEHTEVLDTEQDDGVTRSYDEKNTLRKENFRLRNLASMLDPTESILMDKKQIWLESALRKLSKVFRAFKALRGAKKLKHNKRKRKKAAIPIVSKQIRPNVHFTSGCTKFWRYVCGLGVSSCSPLHGIKNGLKTGQESFITKISTIVQKARARRACDIITDEVLSGSSSYSLRSATIKS